MGEVEAGEGNCGGSLGIKGGDRFVKAHCGFEKEAVRMLLGISGK